jgi:hypothetical protein
MKKAERKPRLKIPFPCCVIATSCRRPIEILVQMLTWEFEKGVITCVIPAGSGSGLGKTLFRTDSLSSSGRIFFFGQEID